MAELADLESRLGELTRQADADPAIIAFERSFREADRVLQIAQQEVLRTRLDPENIAAALRLELKTATPERRQEIKDQLKAIERRLDTEPKIMPLRAAREEAQRALAKARRATLTTLQSDFPELEKRRAELRRLVK